MLSEDVKVDFIELKQLTLDTKVSCYLGWMEAFPTRTEGTRKQVRAVTDVTVPRCGLPIHEYIYIHEVSSFNCPS